MKLADNNAFVGCDTNKCPECNGYVRWLATGYSCVRCGKWDSFAKKAGGTAHFLVAALHRIRELELENKVLDNEKKYLVGLIEKNREKLKKKIEIYEKSLSLITECASARFAYNRAMEALRKGKRL